MNHLSDRSEPGLPASYKCWTIISREQCFSRHLRFAYGNDPEGRRALERGVLSYRAPSMGALHRNCICNLYRSSIKRNVSKLQADERVALYAIFGGIPAYWEQFDPKGP